MEYQKVPINEFPEYQIDTNGIIYNKNGTPKKYSLNHHGYCIVNFLKDGRRYGRQIHVLVAEQFISNPEQKPTVNHIDGDKENNCVTNLEWATYSEQMQHAVNSLSFRPKHIGVKGYNKETGELVYQFNSIIEAGEYFAKQISSSPDYKKARQCQNNIWRVLSGDRYTYKGCIWQYKEQ